jgi:hypothetical protein
MKTLPRELTGRGNRKEYRFPSGVPGLKIDCESRFLRPTSDLSRCCGVRLHWVRRNELQLTGRLAGSRAKWDVEFSCAIGSIYTIETIAIQIYEPGSLLHLA